MAEINPRFLLEGPTPRLIDEWQLAPQLWDAVRFEVDHRDPKGQFILTGSAVPPSEELIHHTGTGRFGWIRMRPMTLFESGDSTGRISLRALFEQPQQIADTNPLDIGSLAFLVSRGGWPRAIDMDGEDALQEARDYYEAVVRADVRRADGIARRPSRVRSLLRAYARHQGTQASNATLMADMTGGDTGSRPTIESDLAALNRIFVIEEMDAWNPNLRSRTALRTAKTRYFVDPSIAAAALGAGPEGLIDDLETFGFLFETLCVRDLRVFADALHGNVWHYRDKTGLECDAVVQLVNGRYGLVEIKLGGQTRIEEGAATLKRLRDKLDPSTMRPPSFLLVLTGLESYAYRRKDGVYVAPIGCLRD